MPQITLVSNEHNHDIRVSVVAELLQPPGDVVIGLMLADIVNKQGADSTTVVGRGDGAVPLLTSCIPNLCLDSLGVDLDGSCRELDADG